MKKKKERILNKSVTDFEVPKYEDEYLNKNPHAAELADKKKGPDPKPKKKGTKNMPPQLRKHAEKKMKGESYKDTLASKLAQSLEEKQKGVDGKACWDGYKRMGTKKKGGKTVDNCVKIKK